MNETARVFGNDARLVGVLDQGAGGDVAVILLNAGLIHHVGPHRLYTRMSRRLAANGRTVLRFDLSGIGDTLPRPDDLPFEQSAPAEVREAMDFVESTCGCRRFILMGICSGAAISFQTAALDDRVHGIILVNAQAHQGDAQLSAYVEQRHKAWYLWHVSVFNPRSWKRAITGKVSYRALLAVVGAQLRGLFSRRRDLEVEGHDVRGDLGRLHERGTRILLLYSAGDPGLALLDAVAGPEVERMKRNGLLDMQIVDDADHIFTPLWSQQELMDRVARWVEGIAEEGAER